MTKKQTQRNETEEDNFEDFGEDEDRRAQVRRLQMSKIYLIQKEEKMIVGP